MKKDKGIYWAVRAMFWVSLGMLAGLFVWSVVFHESP